MLLIWAAQQRWRIALEREYLKGRREVSKRMHGSGLNTSTQPENSREFLDVNSPSHLFLDGTIFALLPDAKPAETRPNPRKSDNFFLTAVGKAGKKSSQNGL